MKKKERGGSILGSWNGFLEPWDELLKMARDMRYNSTESARVLETCKDILDKSNRDLRKCNQIIEELTKKTRRRR